MNHTKYNRVCKLSSAHTIGQSITKQLTYTKDTVITNLNAGIYTASINGKTYVFDLFKSLSGSDRLVIHDANNAYIIINEEKFIINLYELIGRNDMSNQYQLNNTLNDAIDIIMVDGLTDVVYANGKSEQSIDYPASINSISSIGLTASHGSKSEPLNILLKNNIKSLPNGIKDTFIINAEQQYHHIIFRIGRTILSGSEKWEVMESMSNDKYTVFKCTDSNVKAENSANNLHCSHFVTKQCSELVKTSNAYNGISTLYGSYGNGFFLKISTDIVGASVEELSTWLNAKLTSENPIIVEYPLADFRYKTVLLDEYHVKTYFPSTTLSIDKDYDISYFYKSLNII
jgi:hypothetical protein